MDEAALIERITERLRKDHPDPEMRAQLYEGSKLVEYVQTLAQEIADDEGAVRRVADGVRAAEDGQPAT